MIRAISSMACLAFVVVAGAVLPAAPAAADALCSTNCYEVDVYGADNTGVADSTADIQEAIDAAADYTSTHPDETATVVLSAGTYKISDSIHLSGVANLVVEGAGEDATHISLEAFYGHFFYVQDSRNVTIRGLEVNRPDGFLPWTQLTVQNIAGYSSTDPNGYIDVAVDSGYPNLGDAIFDSPSNGLLGYAQDAEGNFGVGYFGKGASVDAGDPTQWRYEVSPGVWRLHFYNISWNRFFVGQRVALITAEFEGIALAFARNQDVTVENVTNHASSFMGLWSSGMENLVVDNYRAMPAAGRLLTSTRDAIHLTGYNRGSLRVSNSTFGGSGDDAINYTMITHGGVQVVSDTVVTIENEVARVGDTIEIYGAGDRVLKGVSTVAAIDGDTVTFSSPISGMSNGDLFHNNDGSFTDAVIENNTFLNHRGRGILPHGLGVTISGNTFIDVPQAILVNTVANGAGEGPINREVLIENNTFENVLFTAAIEIGGEGVATASRDSAHNFAIRGNSFTEVTQPIVLVDLAEGVEIEDNFVSVAGTRPLDLIELGRSVMNVEDVTISGLEVQAAAESGLHSIVDVRSPISNLTIEDLGGQFTASQFVNNLGRPITFNGVSTTSTIGPTGPQAKHFWDFDSTVEGWSNGLNLGITASGGAMEYTTIGADASILSPTALGIDAASNRYLKFSLENSTAGDAVEIFFTTTSDNVMNYAKEVSVSVLPSSGRFEEYIVDMGANSLWTGTIDRIRLDVPDQSTGGGTGRFDYVLLSNSAGEGLSSTRWDFSAGLDGMTLYNIASSSVSGGNFNYSSTANPIIITQRPLNLSAQDYSYIKVVLKNTAPGNVLGVYFTTDDHPSPSEETRLSVPVASNSSSFVTYYIDTNHRNWTGNLLDIRFDLPSSGGTSHSSEIQSISLVGDLTLDGFRTGLPNPDWTFNQ